MFPGMLHWSLLSGVGEFSFCQPRNGPGSGLGEIQPGERVVVVQESGPQRGECFVLERRDCYWAVVGEARPHQRLAELH